MIDRRTFAALFAGAFAAPRLSWGEELKGKTVFYASIGPGADPVRSRCRCAP